MKLFTKKSTAPVPIADPAPAAAPLTQAPTAPLKLDLPDLFAFADDVTKVKTARRAVAAGGETATGAHRHGTVLLVESDAEIARLLSRLLQHEGFELLTASCLAEARRMIADAPVDFLLARRACVPANLQTEIALRDLRSKTQVRIVDEFADLMLGQLVDYEAMARCTLGLTELLVSLFEGANAGARGHAHTVAKYCRLVGQRLGLSRHELDGLTLAALVHDLGTLETQRQISAPEIGPKELRLPCLRTTLDLLADVAFPYPVADLLAANAELAAPAEATNDHAPPHVSAPTAIFRVVDIYDTLRRSNQPEFADEDAVFDWLRRQPGGVFDSDALETLIHIRKHERAIHAMNIFCASVLLVDPHPDELHLLRLRLENDDYRVLVARSVEEALHKLRTETVALVLTERTLDAADRGLELLRTIKADPALRHIPVVLHALPDTERIKQALELGAEDWFAKPHNVEIAAMKLQRIINRSQHASTAPPDGVYGALRDLGLIEMVQILCSCGRSVQIELETAGARADLTLFKGRIVTAHCGDLSGSDAALAVLGWRDGTFRIKPISECPPVTIHGSTDSLLAETCSRQNLSSTAHATR